MLLEDANDSKERLAVTITGQSQSLCRVATNPTHQISGRNFTQIPRDFHRHSPALNSHPAYSRGAIVSWIVNLNCRQLEYHKNPVYANFCYRKKFVPRIYSSARVATLCNNKNIAQLENSCSSIYKIPVDFQDFHEL